MKKTTACAFFFIISCFAVSAQVDSSASFTSRITGGSSKNWFTRPVIIDNPADIKFSTLIFDIKTKTGSITRPRGRDIVGSFRNFSNWKIQKKDKDYLLLLSANEKYIISFSGTKPGMLVLTAVEGKRTSGISIAGRYFEAPLKLN